MIDVKNLAFIRSHSELGTKIAEAFDSVVQQASNGQEQTNANPTGSPNPPPPVDALHVTGQNGHFNIAVEHNQPFYRDVKYFVEHADNPHFKNPHVIDLGTSRNHNIFLGNVTRYWRAYSSYGSSGPSAPVYMGSRSQPQAIQGGGAIGGPSFTAAQGSGTGQAGVGLEGQGKVPFRPVAGGPPVR